jgi:hypothetical protein
MSPVTNSGIFSQQDDPKTRGICAPAHGARSGSNLNKSRQNEAATIAIEDGLPGWRDWTFKQPIMDFSSAMDDAGD